ncbi:MAG: TlpA family protein disulfide reductase [Alistipes sp.]|nr:TlpA family protein disulfide reductase [Alistipes sp.]
MREWKRHINLAIGCCLAACITLMGGCDIIEEELPTYAQTSIVNVGEKAPEFSIEALDGTTLRMPNGEPTLLILFSHTCPDCKNMMVDLQQYIAASSAKHNIMAISRGGTHGEIEAFKDEHGLQYAIAADESANIYYKYATMYVPRCYIIDRSGTIRHTTYEYTTGDVELLISQLDKLD